MPYLILVLGARSVARLQRLHNTIIPPEARLTRDLFAQLLQECEDLLDTGTGIVGSVDSIMHPNDHTLLQEFKRACPSTLAGPNVLRWFYEGLLRDVPTVPEPLAHSDTEWFGFVPSGNYGWQYSIDGTLSDIPGYATFIFHQNDQLLTFNVAFHFDGQTIDSTTIEALCSLRRWNTYWSHERNNVVTYKVGDHAFTQPPPPNTRPNTLHEAKLAELVALVRKLGLPLVLDKSS
ncbi:hypothetical protein HZA85_04065 [Candidatus Uhrbacteria bacterium]|nr:hypothetical protein [Candidatus Uhrbacteria bacterium]